MTTPEIRQQRIDVIRRFPDDLMQAVSPLTEEQLTTTTIPGEWTVAQNVHHTADSHLNAYIRLKLMLAEDHPTLKPYDEGRWAHFPDAHGPNFDATFALLRGLHERWVTVWESVEGDQWDRAGYHPEMGEDISVDDLLKIYATHCEAHLDQIRRTVAAYDG